jgi:gamma-D-glutamyl-L-lysine dipeptidyl-peptidase
MRWLCWFVLVLTVGVGACRQRPATPTTAPGEIRRGLPHSTTDPAFSERFSFDRLLRPIEPSMHGQASRVGLYIDAYKQHCITDRRLFAFDVSGEPTREGQVLLTGLVEYPQHHDSLLRLLHHLGFDHITDRIEMLPTPALGEMPYGLVIASHTFLYDKTTEPRRKISQAIYAEPLFLLKETPDGHYLCHGIDGYVGYVAASDVRRLTSKEFHAYQDATQAYLQRDFKFNDVVIPAAARLCVASVTPQKVTLKSPAGEKFSIPATQLEIGDPRPTHQINLIIDTALSLLKTTYVWSGKTSSGIDCSGLVQSAFKAHGINLPRDADQQSLVGSLVATRWDRSGLRRGDLLFFLSRRGTVSHVAIYLGNSTYLQGAGKNVHISSFDPNAANYDKEHDHAFCFAKRLLE